jgi:hypothetical protein
MYRSHAELDGPVMLCMGTQALAKAMKSKALTLYVFAFSGATKDGAWPTPAEVYIVCIHNLPICKRYLSICNGEHRNQLKMSLQAHKFAEDEGFCNFTRSSTRLWRTNGKHLSGSPAQFHLEFPGWQVCVCVCVCACVRCVCEQIVIIQCGPDG